MRVRTVRLDCYISRNSKECMKRLSKQLGRSMSDVVDEALSAYHYLMTGRTTDKNFFGTYKQETEYGNKDRV